MKKCYSFRLYSFYIVIKKHNYFDRVTKIIDEGPNKELKKNPLNKIIKESIKKENNSKFIIKEKKNFSFKCWTLKLFTIILCFAKNAKTVK